MSVFATKFFEAMTEDVNGGNNWTWNPIIDGNKHTGPGAPTKTTTHTHVGGKDDTVEGTDCPAESKNCANGAMVA